MYLGKFKKIEEQKAETPKIEKQKIEMPKIEEIANSKIVFF